MDERIKDFIDKAHKDSGESFWYCIEYWKTSWHPEGHYSHNIRSTLSGVNTISQDTEEELIQKLDIIQQLINISLEQKELTKQANTKLIGGPS